MALLGKRTPFECDYTIGLNANGQLQAVVLNYYVDCGSYLNDGVGSASMAMVRICAV
jgi:xanthine dehydrogenase molybdopterin-binding subunit B